MSENWNLVVENERSQVLTILQNRLSLSEPDLTLFDQENLSHFLAFDYLYVTEPTEFKKLLSHEAEPLFLGFLPSTGLKQGMVDEKYTWFRLKPGSSESEIKEVFEYDPKLADNSCIGTYVRNGYVMPENASWVIWFSTYWEMAVAGFHSEESLSSFKRAADWISYYKNDQPDIISIQNNPMTKSIATKIIL